MPRDVDHCSVITEGEVAPHVCVHMPWVGERQPEVTFWHQRSTRRAQRPRSLVPLFGGLLLLFASAVFVSRHAIRRVYDGVAAESDAMDDEHGVREDVEASMDDVLSDATGGETPRSRHSSVPVQKQYSHGMLQRVVEGAMRHLHHRRKKKQT